MPDTIDRQLLTSEVQANVTSCMKDPSTVGAVAVRGSVWCTALIYVSVLWTRAIRVRYMLYVSPQFDMSLLVVRKWVLWCFGSKIH